MAAQQQWAGAGAAPSAVPLQPRIVEITSGETRGLVSALASFEFNAAGSIAAQASKPGYEGKAEWLCHTFLPPGAHAETVQYPARNLSNVNMPDFGGDVGDEAMWGPTPVFVAPGTEDDTSSSAAIAFGLHSFASGAFAMVERESRDRLARVWESLEPFERASLRWHFILTVARYAPGTVLHAVNNPVHADAFDGTIALFALASNIMGTPIYPDAVFAEEPLDQFVAEADGGPGCRPDAIRLLNFVPGHSMGETGPLRPWHTGSCVILPAAVAHAIPSGVVPADTPRWFCRVTVEIVPACGGQVDVEGHPFAQHGGWGSPGHPGIELRRKVCALVAEHVWGDESFAAAARARLGLE